MSGREAGITDLSEHSAKYVKTLEMPTIFKKMKSNAEFGQSDPCEIWTHGRTSLGHKIMANHGNNIRATGSNGWSKMTQNHIRPRNEGGSTLYYEILTLYNKRGIYSK